MKTRYIDDIKFRVTLGDIVAGVRDSEKSAKAHLAFIAAQGRRAYIAKPGNGGRVGKTKRQKQ